jgi:hypothetical protein
MSTNEDLTWRQTSDFVNADESVSIGAAEPDFRVERVVAFGNAQTFCHNDVWTHHLLKRFIRDKRKFQISVSSGENVQVWNGGNK